MKTMSLTFVLVTVMAFAATARADEAAVSNSCGLLVDAAKARAVQSAQDLSAHMQVSDEGGRDAYGQSGIGAGLLPALMLAIKSGVPARAFQLAHDAQTISDQMKALDAQIDDLNKQHLAARDRASKLQAGYYDKDYTYHVLARQPKAYLKAQKELGDLAARLTAASQSKKDLEALSEATWTQLRADMATRTVEWHESSVKGRGFIGSVVEACTKEFLIRNEDKSVAFCGYLDLATGAVTYSLATQEHDEWAGDIYSTIADLGYETPAQVARSGGAWARLKEGLFKRQTDPMPELCKKASAEAAAQLAEAVGAKIVDAIAWTPANAGRFVMKGQIRFTQ